MQRNKSNPQQKRWRGHAVGSAMEIDPLQEPE